MKNLIGKKVRGFGFNGSFDNYNGVVGEIKEFYNCTNVYRVVFPDGMGWNCHGDLIEQHLVDLTESTDTLTDAIKEAIIKAYFNGTNLPQIRESIKQAYSAIEAGVKAQLVEIKKEREKA